MAFNLSSPARPSSQRPPNGYHYQRSPSSSSPAGPPVFPSGIPVSRSHLGGSSSSSSPTKARPQSVAVGRGTPGRRAEGGHAASKSLDVSGRSPASFSTPPAAPVNMADVERDFQTMMVSSVVDDARDLQRRWARADRQPPPDRRRTSSRCQRACAKR
jgi:hypothetical protein